MRVPLFCYLILTLKYYVFLFILNSDFLFCIDQYFSNKPLKHAVVTVLITLRP